MTQHSEANLIKEFKQGSISALGAIYNLYSSELYAYCVALSKQREDAEEIVQDVFMQLWLDRSRIRSERSIRNLLFVMAKHRLINAFRATLNAPIFEDYTDYLNTLTSPESQPVEYDDFYRSFQQAIDRLPPTQQKVVRMSKIKNLSNKEIAHALSLSEQTVKNQLSMGMKQLRTLLQKLVTVLIFIQQLTVLLVTNNNQI